VSAKDGSLTAVIWDFEQPQQKLSNRSFYTKLVTAHPAAECSSSDPSRAAGCLQHRVHRTGTTRTMLIQLTSRWVLPGT